MSSVRSARSAAWGSWGGSQDEDGALLNEAQTQPLQEATATWGVTRWGHSSSCLGFLITAKGTPILMGESCHRLNAHGAGGLERPCRSAETGSDAGGESSHTQAHQPHALIQGGKRSLLRVPGGRSLVLLQHENGCFHSWWLQKLAQREGKDISSSLNGITLGIQVNAEITKRRLFGVKKLTPSCLQEGE